jgi:RND family efflux transporter MFP subunit
MNRTLTLTLWVALALASAGTPGCKKPEATATADTSTAAASAAPPTLRFARVVKKKMPRRLEVTGTLDADQRSEVAAQVPGAVMEVLVDVGSRVKKGDVLVKLDEREAALRLARDSASAKQQYARLGLKPGQTFDIETVPEVRAAREQRDLAKAELTRAETLFQGGGISQANLDAARANHQRAEANYDAQRNLVEQSHIGLSVASAQAQLSAKSVADARIKAPFDGVVVERRISPGEHAAIGRVVVVLVSDQPLRFRFEVAEADVGAVTEGLAVELSVAAFKNRRFSGTVKRVSGSIKPQSRTLPIEAEVPNDKHELRPGFFARGSLALAGEEEDALLVPASAVGTTGSARRVFVRSGDRVSERLVTVDAQLDGMLVVRGSLEASDEVAVDGVERLSDGALVAVQN